MSSLIKGLLLLCTFIASCTTNSYAQDGDPLDQTEPINFIQFTQEDRINLTPQNLNAINPNLATVFLVHGWYTSVSIDIYLLNITTAYRDLNDRNVIFVDWSNTAANSYTDVVYNGMPRVGRKIGEMILRLHDDRQIDVGNVHIVGVNVGAHIAGYAGRYVRSNHPENAGIGRITALEASGDLFERVFGFIENPLSLRSTDAEIVDVTHTNSMFFGTSESIGTVDFYVNGGATQGFCGSSSLLDLISPTIVNTCSHAFAIILFRLTINNENYRTSTGSDSCTDSIVYGDKLNKASSGIYYINTEGDWPYRTSC